MTDRTTEKKAKKSLMEKIKKSRMNLKAVDGRRYSYEMSGMDLSGEYMVWVWLENANLSGANLSGVNASCAQLSFANLSGANLSGTNFEGGALYHANLSGANLEGSELYNVTLEGANLIGANLIRANLEYTNLKNATVLKAIFGNNQGIDEDLKAALIEKGAIFEDAPGDRSSVLTPV